MDDHPIIRKGFKLVIRDTSDLEVCGEAESVAEALAAVEATKPDLVIVDLILRGSHGLDLIKELCTLDPKLPMLVVSLHREQDYGELCLRAGARGYINKQHAPEELVRAIRQVLAGECYCSPELTKQLDARGSGEKPPVTDPFLLLADRELQVFELVGRGRETQEIAAEFQLDPSTIETHRRRIGKNWAWRRLPP